MLSTNVILLAIVIIGLIYLYYNKNFREGVCTAGTDTPENMKSLALWMKDASKGISARGVDATTSPGADPACGGLGANNAQADKLIAMSAKAASNFNAATGTQCSQQLDKTSCTNAVPWIDSNFTQTTLATWWNNGGTSTGSGAWKIPIPADCVTNVTADACVWTDTCKSAGCSNGYAEGKEDTTPCARYPTEGSSVAAALRAAGGCAACCAAPKTPTCANFKCAGGTINSTITCPASGCTADICCSCAGFPCAGGTTNSTATCAAGGCAADKCCNCAGFECGGGTINSTATCAAGGCAADKCCSCAGFSCADGTTNSTATCAAGGCSPATCCTESPTPTPGPNTCTDCCKPLYCTADVCTPPLYTWDSTKNTTQCTTGVCDPKECCHREPNPVCEPGICNDASLVWKEHTSVGSSCGKFPGKICTADDCCDKSAICTTATCPKPSWILKDTMNGQYCAERGMCPIGGICCEAAATCLTHPPLTCGNTEHMMDQPENKYCSKIPCTIEECCVGNPPCTEESCLPGWAPNKNLGKPCTNDPCSYNECCSPKPTCDGIECGKNSHKKNPVPKYCDYTTKGECSWPSCCQKNEVCKDNFNCGTDMRLNTAMLGKSCKGATCEATDCCLLKGECQNVNCLNKAGYSPSATAPTTCTKIDPTTNQCPFDECCAKNPTCQQGMCGTGTTLWETAGSQGCKGAICTQEECCRRLESCINVKCQPGTSYSKDPTKISTKFAGDMQTTCCTPNPTCTKDDCGPGYHLPENNKSRNCLNKECTQEECCSKNPTCFDYNCTEKDYYNINRNVVCSGSDCTDKDCCMKMPTCATFQCTYGRQYKAGWEKIQCNETCDDAVCCEPIPQPTCGSQFPCPVHTMRKPNSDSINCAGDACTDFDCCESLPMPTCSSSGFKCPAYYHALPQRQNVTCRGYKCTIGECCGGNPTCGEYQCPEGYSSKDRRIICKEQQCTTVDCCVKNNVCSSVTCEPGFIKKSNSIVCDGPECGYDECCVVRPPPPPPPPRPDIDTTLSANYFSGSDVFVLPDLETYNAKYKNKKDREDLIISYKKNFPYTNTITI